MFKHSAAWLCMALHGFHCFPPQVGWFSTGDEINATSAVIHAFYCKKESSQFNPTAALPGPLHLLIDTSLSQQSFGIKTFVNVRTAVAENLLQFHEVPLKVQTSAAEKSSISQLMHARRANREAQATRSSAKARQDMKRSPLHEDLFTMLR